MINKLHQGTFFAWTLIVRQFNYTSSQSKLCIGQHKKYFFKLNMLRWLWGFLPFLACFGVVFVGFVWVFVCLVLLRKLLSNLHLYIFIVCAVLQIWDGKKTSLLLRVREFINSQSLLIFTRYSIWRLPILLLQQIENTCLFSKWKFFFSPQQN